MLILPRGYLSPSQVEMWETDRPKYIRKYILGQDITFSSKYTEYGNKFGLAMETDEETDDELINLAKEIVPKYSFREKVLETMLETKDGWFILMGKLDTFEEEPLMMREYKTGGPKWTQARVDKSNQVIHYLSLIYLIYKRLPEKAHLDWLETHLVNGEVKLTGNYEAFEIKKTLADVLVYLSKVTKIAKEIDKLCRQHLSGKQII